MTKYTIIFGAPDPEAELAERVAREGGHHVLHAVTADGRRVRPHEAYNAPRIDGELCGLPVVLFECDPVLPACTTVVARCDHHREGDPGYGAPPERFWEASSLGQLCALLGVDPTDELRLAAAADHCPAAAYRGRCPGVDPSKLRRWRAATRAKFQRRLVTQVLADVERALIAIERAPHHVVGETCVADLRHAGEVPELPEASLVSGRPVLYRLPAAGPRVPEGATAKEGLLGDEGGRATAALLERWRDDPATVGEPWGDPARGFCGRWVRD